MTIIEDDVFIFKSNIAAKFILTYTTKSTFESNTTDFQWSLVHILKF